MGDGQRIKILYRSPRCNRGRVAGLLDGMNNLSAGLMATVTWQLGRAALVDAVTIGLGIMATVLVFRLHLNSASLVLGGALVGFATKLSS